MGSGQSAGTLALDDEVVKTLGRLASEAREIRALYLFGSRHRDAGREDSDFDLGALFEAPPDLDALIRLEDRFEREIGFPVDLVDLAHCDPYLALEAIDGHCLFRRDEAVDEFELYVLRRAGDLAPFERERRSALLDASPSRQARSAPRSSPPRSRSSSG